MGVFGLSQGTILLKMWNQLLNVSYPLICCKYMLHLFYHRKQEDEYEKNNCMWTHFGVPVHDRMQ